MIKDMLNVPVNRMTLLLENELELENEWLLTDYNISDGNNIFLPDII